MYCILKRRIYSIICNKSNKTIYNKKSIIYDNSGATYMFYKTFYINCKINKILNGKQILYEICSYFNKHKSKYLNGKQYKKLKIFYCNPDWSIYNLYFGWIFKDERHGIFDKDSYGHIMLYFNGKQKYV